MPYRPVTSYVYEYRILATLEFHAENDVPDFPEPHARLGPFAVAAVSISRSLDTYAADVPYSAEVNLTYCVPVSEPTGALIGMAWEELVKTGAQGIQLSVEKDPMRIQRMEWHS